jgi:hypothetical protein
MGRFDGALLAKVALGDNYETVGVSGSSITSGFGGVFPAGGAVFPGGLFADATNIGQQAAINSPWCRKCRRSSATACRSDFASLPATI